MHGDYRKLFDAPARIDAVTREDVRKVAGDLLQQKRRTVGVVQPSVVQPSVVPGAAP
jgi:zinc protease